MDVQCHCPFGVPGRSGEGRNFFGIPESAYAPQAKGRRSGEFSEGALVYSLG